MGLPGRRLSARRFGIAQQLGAPPARRPEMRRTGEVSWSPFAGPSQCPGARVEGRRDKKKSKNDHHAGDSSDINAKSFRPEWPAAASSTQYEGLGVSSDAPQENGR